MNLIDIFSKKSNIEQKQIQFVKYTERDLKLILLDMKNDFEEFKGDIIRKTHNEINNLTKRIDAFHDINLSVNTRLC